MTDNDETKPEAPETGTDDAEAKAEAAARAQADREAAEAAKLPWERDPVMPEWQEAEGDSLAVALRSAHSGAVKSARTFAGDLVITVERQSIQEICRSLKENHGYVLLVDICAVHYPEREEPGFEVIYQVYNFEENRRICLKVEAADGVEVPSVTPVWRGANWLEREVYDMFGVRFSDHPDMTRILLWEGFNGYPLRKEFPVEGIDTGSAIYPEYYEEQSGPVAGTGTGWKPTEPGETETS